jgi:hypothetical protein
MPKAPVIEIFFSMGKEFYLEHVAAIDGQGCSKGFVEIQTLSTNPDGAGTCRTSISRESYRVVQNSAKDFAVHLHYEFPLPGAKWGVFKGTLPVLAKPIATADKGWTEITPGIKVAAYYTGAQMYY